MNNLTSTTPVVLRYAAINIVSPPSSSLQSTDLDHLVSRICLQNFGMSSTMSIEANAKNYSSVLDRTMAGLKEKNLYEPKDMCGLEDGLSGYTPIVRPPFEAVACFFSPFKVKVISNSEGVDVVAMKRQMVFAFDSFQCKQLVDSGWIRCPHQAFETGTSIPQGILDGSAYNDVAMSVENVLTAGIRDSHSEIFASSIGVVEAMPVVLISTIVLKMLPSEYLTGKKENGGLSLT